MKKKLIISHVENKNLLNENSLFKDDYEIIYITDSKDDQKLPDYVIIDNIDALVEVRKNYAAKELDVNKIKFMFIGRNNQVQEFLDFNGTFILDPSMLKNTLATSLIQNSLTTTPVVHLEEIFGKNFDKYYSYKVSNIYRLGYYSDLICKDAIAQKLNFVSIRTFFDHAMLLNAYLVDLGLAQFPCEIEFSFKDNQLVLLLHMATSGLKHNHLVESFGDDNNKNPMSSLLKTCFKQTDFLDIVNHIPAKRFSILGYWASEEIRSELITSSLALNTIELVTEKNKNNPGQNFNYDFNHQSDPADLEKLDASNLPQLPGTHRKLEAIAEDSIFRQEEGLLQEVSAFVQNQIEIKNLELDDPSKAIKLSDLNADEVKEILKDYPDQELIQSFKAEDQEVLTSVVTAGKSADELIHLVSDKKEKQKLEDEITLSSGAEKLVNQVISTGNLFKESESADSVITTDNKLMANSEIKLVMGNIEKELVTTFSTEEIDLLPEEQTEIITDSIIKNALKMNNVANGEVDVDEVVEEIIENMSLPQDQKLAFKKKIKNKVKNNNVIKKTEPKVDEALEIEEIVEEIVEVDGNSEVESINLKTTPVKKVVKKVIKKVVKNNPQANVQINEQVNEIEEEIEEVIEEVFEESVEEAMEDVASNIEKKKITKIVKVPKENIEKIKKTEVEEELISFSQTDDLDIDSNHIVSGSDDVEIGPEYKVKQSSKIPKKKEDQDKIIVSGSNDDNGESGDDVQVVSGSNDFEMGSEYKVRPSSKSPKKKNDLEKVVVSGSDNDDDNEDLVQVVTGSNKLPSSGGYKVKAGSGTDDQNDAEDILTVKENSATREKDKEFKVADNSHLVKKVEELEKKLQDERAKVRELEKNKNQTKEKVKSSQENDVIKISATLKEPDLGYKPSDPKVIIAMEKEIKDIPALNEMQKAKMLEVLEKEKQINEKYAEIQEAYRKVKTTMDIQENKYSAQIDELERSNRHKELLVEQIKTKLENSEKDHQKELRRITFDLKKQTQRAALGEVDKYKSKIAALEREKNATKRMFDEFKANASREKVKVIDSQAKESPKVFEFEAQKKRAEVKLAATESELVDLKKTMTAKDQMSKEVAEQRHKYETEMNKWKKDALTKQSEVEKAQVEKKLVEQELISVKRRLEDLTNQVKESKKATLNTEHLAETAKVSASSVKQAEDKILAIKEEMNKEKSLLNKELAKEKEQMEEMKKSYLIEANKVKALETKAKEMANTIEEQAAALKTLEAAAADAAGKGNAGNTGSASKDVSALTTKNRLLEDTNKKLSKDSLDSKAKLDEAKKEIANLTKKTNETLFKLQEKEKLAEKLQNELKVIKDKEAEAKKKEAEAKKAA